METSDPFILLKDIERRCELNAGDLPGLDKADDEWVGIGFRIGNDKLIASMSEVEEILDLPQYTIVPGVKSWVVGVANVRGSLLPLLDLKGFILGEDMHKRKNGRVIVIDYKGFNTGLLVEEVYGMRHFTLKDQTSELPEVHENISPYLEKAFLEDESYWPIFSFRNMAQDEKFSQASL